jgi:hypothetical protein
VLLAKRRELRGINCYAASMLSWGSRSPTYSSSGTPCRPNRFERCYLTPLVCDKLHIIDVECLIAATTHTGVIVGLVQCRLCSSIDHVACTVSAAARSFARVVSGLKRSGRGLVSAAVVASSQLQCVRELTWASALDQLQRLRSQLERWQRVRRIASQLTDHTSSDWPLLCGNHPWISTCRGGLRRATASAHPSSTHV